MDAWGRRFSPFIYFKSLTRDVACVTQEEAKRLQGHPRKEPRKAPTPGVRAGRSQAAEPSARTAPQYVRVSVTDVDVTCADQPPETAQRTLFRNESDGSYHILAMDVAKVGLATHLSCVPSAWVNWLN
jgi:hypothetical protein